MWKGKKLLAFVGSLLSILAASLVTVQIPKVLILMVFVLTPAFNVGVLALLLALFAILATVSNETGLVTFIPA